MKNNTIKYSLLCIGLVVLILLVYDMNRYQYSLNKSTETMNTYALDVSKVVESTTDVLDVRDLDGIGLGQKLERISNIYGIDVRELETIDDKIDTLYRARVNYGVDYRLKLLDCLNYNNLYGSRRDYTIEFGVLLGEIKGEYLKELDKGLLVENTLTSDVEITTETTTFDYTSLNITDGKDSMTDVINELSRTVEKDNSSVIGETYDIYLEGADGSYYKTTGVYTE